MYDLSILIPALREEFLADTVRDILKNKRGNTEIIVGLDGEWADPGIPDHPDVRIVYSPVNLGQRGMTNYICRLSTAKYVAKCDAHTAYDEGFDVKLMDAVKNHDDWTIVPVMKNLHVFNWKCTECGDETYQGAIPEGCKSCFVNTPDLFKKVTVWRPKPSPNSSAYKFTPNKLQFKYFGNLKGIQQDKGEPVAETMSLQGSFFMLTREKYWELNICDESWGGWGQQGTEVALKTWLSGGRVVCHLGTWYAHMFRTQDGFAFPWNGAKISQAKQQQSARKASWELFMGNKWDKQVRPLSWVVERFWEPLQQEPHKEDDPKWTQADLDKLKQTESKFKVLPKTEKGIIFYTDNRLNLKIAHAVQKQLKRIGLPIVSSSLKPMTFGDKNVIINEPRGYKAYFQQIIAALETSTAEIVFFCEHDVLYHPSHFEFTPPERDTFYYNQNWVKVRYPFDGTGVSWDADQVSGLVCYRELALDWYRKKYAEYEKDPEHFDRKFEPAPSEAWRSKEPYVDIRQPNALTKSKWSLDDFRDKRTAKNFKETPFPEWAKDHGLS